MQGRTNSDDLVMIALYTYSPAHGCSVYWTGAGWDADGRQAALYASVPHAEAATATLHLPAGATEFQYAHRNMI